MATFLEIRCAIWLMLVFGSCCVFSAPSSTSYCTDNTTGLVTCGDFNDGMCFGQQYTPGKIQWKRSKSITSPSGKTISRDNYFVYLNVSKDALETRDTTYLYQSVDNPVLGDNGLCISFLYASIKDGNHVPNITVLFDGKEIGLLQEDTGGSWVKRSFEVCGSRREGFTFFKLRYLPKSPRELVAIDDVKFSHSSKTCFSGQTTPQPQQQG